MRQGSHGGAAVAGLRPVLTLLNAVEKPIFEIFAPLDETALITCSTVVSRAEG